jgi:hypothetical protein
MNETGLTPEYINSIIKYVDYWLVPGTTTIVCAMVLKNNFVVIGKAVADSRKSFYETIVKRMAYENAKQQIWELEYYLLKDKLNKA